MRFYCSANEFYFCRVFATYSGEGDLHDTLTELSKGGFRRTLLFFISAFPVVIVQGTLMNLPKFPLQMQIGLILTLIFVALILSGFLNIRRSNQEYRHFENNFMNRPKTLSEEVLIYEIKPEGIYFNLYNKVNDFDMLLIPWSAIKKGEIDYLRFPSRRNSSREQSRRAMLKDFKEVKREHHDFKYPNKLTHKDKAALSLYTSEPYHNLASYIPLPVSWKENNKEKRFIEEVRKYIPVEVVEHEEIQLLDLFRRSKAK